MVCQYHFLYQYYRKNIQKQILKKNANIINCNSKLRQRLAKYPSVISLIMWSKNGKRWQKSHSNTSAFKFLCRDKEFQYYANMLFCIHKSVCTETNIRYFVPTHPSKEQSLLSKLHSVKGVWGPMWVTPSYLLLTLWLLFKDITNMF